MVVLVVVVVVMVVGLGGGLRVWAGFDTIIISVNAFFLVST